MQSVIIKMTMVEHLQWSKKYRSIVSITGCMWDNGIMWRQYLAVERVQFSDHRPALGSAARCSARCRRNAGRRGRLTSRCLRSVGCLHPNQCAVPVITQTRPTYDPGSDKHCHDLCHHCMASMAYRCSSPWQSAQIFTQKTWPSENRLNSYRLHVCLIKVDVTQVIQKVKRKPSCGNIIKFCSSVLTFSEVRHWEQCKCPQ